jgi:hypothetical protein
VLVKVEERVEEPVDDTVELDVVESVVVAVEDNVEVMVVKSDTKTSAGILKAPPLTGIVRFRATTDA